MSVIWFVLKMHTHIMFSIDTYILDESGRSACSPHGVVMDFMTVIVAVVEVKYYLVKPINQ